MLLKNADRMLGLRLWVCTFVGIALVTTGGVGCAGRNLHKELKPDPKILVQKWTLMTRSPVRVDAGDHGFEFSNPMLSDHTLIFGNRSVGLISLYPSVN